MDRGLYIAASGMLAEQVRQDQIANDLANVSTPGYKGDRTSQRSFADMLLRNRESGDTVGVTSLGAQIAEIRTDMRQGGLRETEEPLDLALEGTGFLVVQTAEGQRYTRNGRLALDPQGNLVTMGGDRVLGADGQPVRPGAGVVKVAPDGTVSVGGREAGKLA